MWTLEVLVSEMLQQTFGERVLIFLPSIPKMTILSKIHVREMKNLPDCCKKKKIRWHCSVRNLCNAPMFLRQYALELAVC